LVKVSLPNEKNMSRIKEALVFKSDEERMEWFQSLSPDEQAEVVKEAKEIVDNVIKAFLPVAEELGTVAEELGKMFGLWFNEVC
jgi:hypothetical protein